MNLWFTLYHNGYLYQPITVTLSNIMVPAYAPKQILGLLCITPIGYICQIPLLSIMSTIYRQLITSFQIDTSANHNYL